MEEELEEPGLQEESSKYDHLRPWQFKKGQSGNPEGKKKGTISLKVFAKNYIQDLSNEEKIEFLEGIDKKTVWEMAEGKAKQDMAVSGTLSISNVLDSLEHGQQTPRQELENIPPVQNQEQETIPRTIQSE